MDDDWRVLGPWFLAAAAEEFVDLAKSWSILRLVFKLMVGWSLPIGIWLWAVAGSLRVCLMLEGCCGRGSCWKMVKDDY